MSSEYRHLPNSILTEIQNDLGASLLGVFFGLILYGIILIQFYGYCRTFSSDAPFIRSLIIALMILETAHAVITMHYTYIMLVTDYGNLDALTPLPWSFNVMPLMAGLIMICSQLFFVGRIYLIGLRYRIVAGVTSILMLSEICLVIYVAQALSRGGHNAHGLDRPLVATLLVPSVVDTLLTSTLIIALRRTRAGLKQNGGIVDLVVTYGINTGVLHWALNWACFALLVLAKHRILDMKYVSINIAAGRAYAMTFLCVLNSREARSSEVFFSGGAYGLKVIERTRLRAVAETWNVPQIPDDEPRPINIRVTTEMENERGWGRCNKSGSETSSSELVCTP